jgi:hypothetical protein
MVTFEQVYDSVVSGGHFPLCQRKYELTNPTGKLMMIKLQNTKVLLLCAIAAGALTGCASGARTENMTVNVGLPTNLVQSPLKQNIAIKDVTGGQETNPLWKSNIGSIEFERALESSLRNAGLLSENRQAGKYTVTAHLSKVEQPILGISFKVTAHVEYTLVERATGKSVYGRTIAEPYTAGFSDAVLGVERLRLANEGAVRTNIAKFIDEMSRMNIGANAMAIK